MRYFRSSSNLNLGSTSGACTRTRENACKVAELGGCLEPVGLNSMWGELENCGLGETGGQKWTDCRRCWLLGASEKIDYVYIPYIYIYV